MSITISAVGQAAKRGLIPRLPSPDRLRADIAEWLASSASDTIRNPSANEDPTAPPTLAFQLHPAARPIRFDVDETARVVATATTTPVGPGYHTYVTGLIHRLGDELGITWSPAPADGEDGGPAASSDPTAFLASGDRADAERGHLAWLHQAMLAARAARQRGATAIHLETPPLIRFATTDALVTVLGPRTDEWLERALADPRTAADVWPWVADAMDARYLLDRALCQLWLEVRWRPPAGAEEQAHLDEVLALLRRAYPLEPTLAYPWPAWREVMTLRDQPDPATRQLLDRMAPHTGDESPLGYRRKAVTILHEGWALDVPGSFAERRTAEEWYGGEARRSVTLAATRTGETDQPMAPDAFLKLVADHLGPDALQHEDGPVRGRARLATDASSGVEVATLEGYSAVRGLGAAIRIVIEDPQDWKWALDTWRDLRPA